MACLVGWAFLKCSLMGVQQRLGRHDVINLLASGLFGVALATILLLTIGAYSRLSADVDAHLQHLASRGARRVHQRDRTARHGNCRRWSRTVQTDKCSSMARLAAGSGRTRRTPVKASPIRGRTRPSGPSSATADFITFAMVDESGLQAVKAAFSNATRTIVDVNAARLLPARPGARAALVAPTAKPGRRRGQTALPRRLLPRIRLVVEHRPAAGRHRHANRDRSTPGGHAVDTDARAPRARAAAWFRVCRGRFARDRPVPLGSSAERPGEPAARDRSELAPAIASRGAKRRHVQHDVLGLPLPRLCATDPYPGLVHRRVPRQADAAVPSCSSGSPSRCCSRDCTRSDGSW